MGHDLTAVKVLLLTQQPQVGIQGAEKGNILTAPCRPSFSISQFVAFPCQVGVPLPVCCIWAQTLSGCVGWSGVTEPQRNMLCWVWSYVLTFITWICVNVSL